MISVLAIVDKRAQSGSSTACDCVENSLIPPYKDPLLTEMTLLHILIADIVDSSEV